MTKKRKRKNAPRVEPAPCPFCGSPYVEAVRTHRGRWWVECECGAEGPHAAAKGWRKIDAILAWNERVTEAPE